jgi:hypothetical protein
LFPHPIWWAVALLATRYGCRGLAAAAVLGWGLTSLGAALMGVPLALVGARAASGTDLGALLAVVLVAWVASIHERRVAELAASVTALEERSTADRQALSGLRTTAIVLRARADRLETSLTFLRDVAQRLEGRNRIEAAQAALDLAMARIGARAGLVAGADETGLAIIASSGPWEASPDLKGDHTVAAALRNRRATRAVDLADATTGDGDLAAPIVDDEDQTLVGVIALYGVAQGGASAAALHDLALVAAWCARALATSSTSATSTDDGTADDEENGEGTEGTVLQLNL